MPVNLVGEYGSDSDSEGSDVFDQNLAQEEDEDDDFSPSVEREATTSDTGGNCTKSAGSALFGANEDTSSSEDESEDQTRNPHKRHRSPKEEDQKEMPAQKRLPSAMHLFSSKVKTSVFVSDHQREEQEHNAKLSRHVALTELKKEPVGRTKKDICWAAKKGRCRYGDRCKFVHDTPRPPPDPVSVTSAPQLYKSADEVFNKKQ